MHPLRFLLLAALVGFLGLVPPTARAQEAFVYEKQFSADAVITGKDGHVMNYKLFCDNGRVRTEMNMGGTAISAIILPDKQKMYTIMESQKLVMEMPYDAARFKQQMTAATGLDGKVEKIGPETVEGVACTKSKVTSKDDDVIFIWVDAKRTPVKMAAADGSFTMAWKNYVPGPQPASFFEPPVGYQVMTMPTMPELPAPGAPAGQ